MPDSLLPKPFSLQEAKLKNPLALAYLGDTVWDLLIRQRMLAGGLPAGALHRRAILLANAGAQAEAAARIEPALAGYAQRIAGAVHTPSEAAADCRLLCEQLAARLTARGAELRYGVELQGFEREGDAITAET